MGYRYGFKVEASDVAREIRAELSIGPLEQLNLRVLAAHLEIPIVGLSELVASTPSAAHLISAEPEAFSAVTVFDGTRRAIVHNDGHALVRQNSNLAHELSHGLLLHPPTPAMDDKGCRIWNGDIEDSPDESRHPKPSRSPALRSFSGSPRTFCALAAERSVLRV